MQSDLLSAVTRSLTIKKNCSDCMNTVYANFKIVCLVTADGSKSCSEQHTHYHLDFHRYFR